MTTASQTTPSLATPSLTIRPSHADTAACAALEAFAEDFIGYSSTLGQFLAKAAAAPEAPLVQAYAGALHMALEARQGLDASRPFLARAQDRMQSATEAEQRVIGAITLWSRGAVAPAVEALHAHVLQTPGDLLAAKWGQYLAFNLGHAKRMVSFAETCLPAHRAYGPAWGMLAFGLEQTHRLGEAEDAGRRALDLDRGDAWAQHAVAHVLETQGRLEEGVAFLTDHADTWSSRSVFMREHNWWHLALFELDRDNPARVLDIFDRHLWGEWPEFGQEQIGAASLLWRLELRGHCAGGRWSPVAAKIAAQGPDHIWPFHDMHFVYALARDGLTAELDGFLRSLQRKADSTGGVWADVAVPLAHGLAAHAQGRMREAEALIAPVLPSLQGIGGSHAQRDVFVQTWLDAALKSGSVSGARPVLEERLRARPQVAVTRRLLSACV
jgi:hypothetical protein